MKRKRKPKSSRSSSSKPVQARRPARESQVTALWCPGWHGTDQSIAVGVDIECMLIELGALDKAIDAPGIPQLQFSHRVKQDSGEGRRRFKGRIARIRHPLLGELQAIATGGLDYVFTLADGQRLQVNAEEAPGETLDWDQPIADWTVSVWFDSLEPCPL